jgi:hypothetical protein
VDDQTNPGSDPSPSLNAKGAARRRFTKSGTALSGVILTMASRNGMASTVVRGATPSGFISTTPTNSHAPTTAALGRSPGYWKNHPGAWPSTRTSQTAKFGQVFGCPTTNPLYGCTLINVVSHLEPAKSADKGNVAMHIVATLLNVRAHLITCLTEPKVFEIWNGYLLGGYVPVLGAKPWGACEIVRYLQSTMDVDSVQSCGA